VSASSSSFLFDDNTIGALSPELLRAARWVEQHPRDVALQSMRECARRAELRPASFTRLAHALGFDGFDAIKARCQEALAPQAGYAARAQALQATARQSADWLDALNEAQHANTASISGQNRRAQFEQAADAMLAATHVHFLGLRASHGLAFHLHYTYGLIAPNGSLVQGLGGTLVDQLGHMERGDMLVAISLSPYTRQTVEAVEQARKQGVQVLVLTDSQLSPISRLADRVLLFRAEGPSYFHSMVGGLALAEALVAAVAVRGGRKVLDRLTSVQRKLDAQGAYWGKREAVPAAAPASPPPARGRTIRKS
jgi:DNA-binding MurR/RpiR family transcriptional regulator